MVFSSLIFLWIFLPVVFILYFTAKEQYRNIILLIASLFFYAWGEPVYVFVMMLSIVINYFCGLKIGVEDEHKRKRALFWGVFVNLALLGVFKYTGFFTENVNAVFGLQVEVKHLPLPIGISFYTFQSISYLVDIYRRVCEPQKNIVKMGLFISFFPQLIAGPILKYYDIASQIDKRQVTLPLFNEGAVRFLQGLAKKVIIANIMAKTADEIFALGISDISTPTAWIGIIAYTFQIYFDFSGYSDMAIGLGKMFGFHIHENFNHPYTATSIKDFWRRWHISLSTWFKEYLYIPLGGNREGTLKTYRNLMIVFFLTGLWHGASWNFVIWGVFHGTFLVLERIFPIEKILHFRLLKSIYTLLVVIVAWVFFRAETLGSAWAYLNRMFVPYDMESYSKYLSNEFVYVAVLALASCGFGAMLYRRLFALIGRENWGNAVVRAVNPAFCAVIAYFSVLLLASNTYNPFIYFRF